jgi:putative transposase
MAGLFFTEVYGFAVMGNHFYLLVKMIPEDRFDDDEVKRRLEQFYREEQSAVGDGQLPLIRQKLASLSEFVREIKVHFTRFYNKRRGRKGYFWGDRFKSVIVENGETLINCLAYIDLNPARLCPAINRLKFCHRPTRTHTEKGGYPGGDQDAGMSCFLMRSWGDGYLQP